MALRLSILDQSPVPEGSNPSEAIAASLELARAGDRLGYTRYWMAEHHAFATLASTAPEVLLARVGAETSRIRIGSGAVLLPHYSAYKVAEQFRTLHALYPNRVDLGIGRAPGGGPMEARALGRGGQALPSDTFPNQLLDLLRYLGLEGFPPDHPFRQLHVAPETPDGPTVWLLGSSEWSAVTAASYGLPYAFAHFIQPEPTRSAVALYKHRFQPSRQLAASTALVCLGAVVAPTEEEAEYLASSVRLWSRNIRLGARNVGLLPPERAIEELQHGPDPAFFDTGEWPRITVGTPESVRARLTQIATQLGIEELMVLTLTHSYAARLRSYELLAEAFGLEANGAERAAPPVSQGGS